MTKISAEQGIPSPTAPQIQEYFSLADPGIFSYRFRIAGHFLPKNLVLPILSILI